MFLRHLFRIFLLCWILSLTAIAPVRPAAAEKMISQADISTASAVDVPPPALLKDIYTADASSDPTGFFDNGSIVLYAGYDGEHKYELWASDGTVQGTTVITSIDTGGYGSYPAQLTAFRGKVFFTTYTYDYYYGARYDLEATDGTPAGTVYIYDPGRGVNGLLSLGDWLYFSTNNGPLMRYGGPEDTVETLTPAGFQMYPGYGTPSRLVAMNGALYFSGTDGSTGQELWRYDLNTGQLALVKDICPDACLEYSEAGSHPNSMTVVGNTLYFIASDADHGNELWASDGSQVGTRLVKDFYPGKLSSLLDNLTPAGGWLYFTADDGTHGVELWRTDGTPENTTLVSDLAPGVTSATPRYLTVMEGNGNLRLFFSARDGLVGEGHGIELWSVPVTLAGVLVIPALLEIAPGSVSGSPEYLTVLGDTLYFAAQDTPGNIELWKTGGSQETTARVADLVPGLDGSAPEDISIWNGKLIFSAVDAVNGREAWVSDGTAPGTALIGNMAYSFGTLGSYPSAGLLTQVGGRNIRYFTARDPLHGMELWRTDGTSAGTRLVKDIYPGPGDGMYEDDGYRECGSSTLAEMNGSLYFCAEDPENGAALWRSDGTSEGTWIVKASQPAYGFRYLDQLTLVENKLFYLAGSYHGIGQALWVSDGSTTGTSILMDPVPGTNGIPYTVLKALGNQLIFSVEENATSHSFQLWRSDGTVKGTQPFFGPYTFSNDWGYLLNSTSFQDRLYFAMPDPQKTGSCAQLWFTDGTAPGTKMVTLPSGSEATCLPANLVQMDGYLFFTARSSSTGSSEYTYAIWKLPNGSSAAGQVGQAGWSEIGYLGALNSTTLLYLLRAQYPIEDLWFVMDISQGGIGQQVCYGCYPIRVSQPAPWLGRMYFSATGDYYQPASLWATDGTQSGTAAILNPITLEKFISPAHFLNAGNIFYFSANEGFYGSEPWMIRVEMNNQVFLPAVRH